MLNVVCGNWGTKYEDKYVNVLYDMVTKYLHRPFRFVCITDRQRDIYKCIDTVPTHGPHMNWWQKLAMFRPGFIEGRSLFLDLDIIIKGDLTAILEFSDDRFIAIKGLSGRPTYNTSVILWEPSKCHEIWESFKPEDKNRFPTDQEYITDLIGFGTTFPEKVISSYKLSSKEHIDDSSIVVFHGKPNPNEVADDYATLWWG